MKKSLLIIMLLLLLPNILITKQIDYKVEKIVKVKKYTPKNKREAFILKVYEATDKGKVFIDKGINPYLGMAQLLVENGHKKRKRNDYFNMIKQCSDTLSIGTIIKKDGIPSNPNRLQEFKTYKSLKDACMGYAYYINKSTLYKGYEDSWSLEHQASIICPKYAESPIYKELVIYIGNQLIDFIKKVEVYETPEMSWKLTLQTSQVY